MATDIRHIVQTRFAIQVKKMDGVFVNGVPSLSPEWIARRFALFEQYLLPSMQAQTFQNFVWHLYVHPGFDRAYCDRLAAYDRRIRVVTHPVTPVRDGAGILACTRIDSDDGFASHALEVVQRYAEKFAAGRQPVQLLRMKMGWWNDHANSRVYQWRGWSFLTLLERRAPYKGALVASCDDIGRMYPEWKENRPLWLRVVHENNVRNRFDRAQSTYPLEYLHDQGFAWLTEKPEPMPPFPPDEPEPIPIGDPSDPSLPRVALVMQTTDRKQSTRRAQVNYVRSTVSALVRQGVTTLGIQLSKVHDLAWIRQELGPGLLPYVQIHPVAANLSRNATAVAALASVDVEAYDWVVLLEDDLKFCRNFLPSVQRWLQMHGRADRHLFRFWGYNGFRAPARPTVSAFEHPIESKMCAAQAIAWRTDDLRDFLQWAAINLPTWRGHGPGKPNPGIAFDKFVALWHLTRWPKVPGVLSWPFFVDHIGDQSSIHSRGGMNHIGFAGTQWSFQGSKTATVPDILPVVPIRPTVGVPWPYKSQVMGL